MANETLSGLKDEIESQINDEARELYEGAYPEDRIHEMADSTVPVYNGDLADVLASDPDVAYMDDPGLAEGCDDLYRRIAISIYEKLTQHAHVHWGELKDQIDEALDEIDDLQGIDLDDDSSVTLDDLNTHHGDLLTDDDLELLTRAEHESDPVWHEENADDIEDARDQSIQAYQEYRRAAYWEDL